MLDGITVLDIGTKTVEWGWGWSWVGLIWTVIGLISIIVALISLFEDYGGGFLLFGGIVLLGLGFILFAYAKPVKTIPIYTVIVDDSVSMVEFYNKYEILETQGKIYTIIERED